MTTAMCSPSFGRQRLLVTARGSAAEIICFEKTRRETWRRVRRLGVVRGYVGKNGVASRKREGDGKTPAGLFLLGTAFGVREKPETRMSYRPVTKDSYWVDDPQSPDYNRWVEAPGGPRYGAERLRDYPDAYAYGVVIEYNTDPVIPGRGSAVFLHCGDKPTSGCVAVGEADLLKILRWLDPAKKPEILIEDAGASRN